MWSFAAEEPLGLETRLEWGWRLRPIRIGLATFDAFAADSDAKLVQPFHSPRFRAALADASRSLRRVPDRTAAMRWLFSDVLPDDVCARSSKGTFGDVFWNDHSRSFAAEWDGEGADPELVRIDVLQALWRSPQAREHFRSCLQLQAAWLAQQRRRRNGSRDDRVEQPASRVAQ